MIMFKRAVELGLDVRETWHIKVLTRLVNKELNRLKGLAEKSVQVKPNQINAKKAAKFTTKKVFKTQGVLGEGPR